MVWHGADKYGVRSIEGYCDAWNTNQRHKYGLASSFMRGKLLDQELNSCNQALIVLCIEVSSQDDNNWSTRTKRSADADHDDADGHQDHIEFKHESVFEKIQHQMEKLLNTTWMSSADDHHNNHHVNFNIDDNDDHL